GTDWVLKPAFGHEGRDVVIAGVSDADEWKRIQAQARGDPDAWAAQRRFELLPVDTPDGPMYPCLGIYVIDGVVAGAYGRVPRRARRDVGSRDVAVLGRAPPPTPPPLENNPSPLSPPRERGWG